MVFCVPRWNISSSYPNWSFSSLHCEFVTSCVRPEQLQCISCSETFYASSNSVGKFTETKGSISLQVLLTFSLVTLDYCSVPAFSTHMHTHRFDLTKKVLRVVMHYWYPQWKWEGIPRTSNCLVLEYKCHTRKWFIRRSMEVSAPLTHKKLFWCSSYLSGASFGRLSVGGFLFILPLCVCFAGTQPTAWRSPCPWQWQRMTRTSATTPRCGSLRRRSWAKAKRSRARELRIFSSQERSQRLFGIRYLTILNLLKSGHDQHAREERKWMSWRRV